MYIIFYWILLKIFLMPPLNIWTLINIKTFEENIFFKIGIIKILIGKLLWKTKGVKFESIFKYLLK